MSARRKKMNEPPTVSHDREIALLKAGQGAIRQEVEGVVEWIKKAETSIDQLAQEMRTGFARFSQKNPMVVLGMASLSVSLVLVVSGLNFFTINSQVTPVREAQLRTYEALKFHSSQERLDFEQIVRHDEKLKYFDERLKKIESNQSTDKPK